jgi:hypothetical protein
MDQGTNGSSTGTASSPGGPPPVSRPPAAGPAANAPAADPLLRDYLARRDAPCPSCGYNLRDNAHGACPECGEALTLHLHPAGPMARRGGLLLLVFLWLLAASSIQGYISGRSIHQAATSPFNQVLTLFRNVGGAGATINLPSIVASPGPNAGGGFSFQIGGSGTVSGPAPAAGSTAAPATASRLNRTITLPPIQPVPTMAPIQIGYAQAGGYNWSAVTWKQWTQASVWTGLLIAALTGVILLLILRRRREASPGLSRAISVLAWSGFGVFCAMHLAGTVFELI